MIVKSVFYLIPLLGLFSIISLKTSFSISDKLLFEMMFFVIVVFSVRKVVSVRVLPLFLVLLGYLIYSVIVAIFLSNANILDFIQAYKAYFYALCLFFLVGKHEFSVNPKFYFNLLLSVFFVKYLIVYFGLGLRPILFVENNFELVFLLFSLIGMLATKQRIELFQFFGLMAVFVLSGSRSALVCLFAVLVIENFRRLYKPQYLLMLVVISLFGITVFLDRMNVEAGIGSIDRFKFMMVFGSEVNSWKHTMLGATPITPLSAQGCSTLSFYKDLFSYKGDGSCYAVIFHSYILRGLFDHGVVFLLSLLAFYWYVFRASHLPIKYIFMSFSVLLLTGLSVSSFNSVFALLGVVYVVLLSNSQGNVHQIH